MGREVVYCHRCQTRLRGEDFDTGAAFRVGDKITCAPCLEEIAQELPLAERLALLSKIKEFETKAPPAETTRAETAPARTASRTHRIPVSSKEVVPATTRRGSHAGPDTALRRSKTGMIVGIAGVAVALLGLLLLATAGGRKGRPEGEASSPGPIPEITAQPARPPEPAPAAPKSPLDEVRKYCRDNPRDLAGHVKAWEKVLWEVGGTVLEEAKVELEAAKKRLKEVLAPDLAAVEEKWRGHMGKEEFKQAQDLLEKERPRHDTPEWTLAIDKRLREIQETLGSILGAVKQGAVEARSRNDSKAMAAIRERVARWGLEDCLADINRIFEGSSAGPEPVPAAAPEKPLSKEGQDYRRRWEQAAIAAACRKYDDAIAEIEKASRSLEEADVKAEAQKDIDIFRKLAATCLAAIQALSEWPRLSLITLTYYDESGNRRSVTDRVLLADAHHLEIRQGKKIMFVDLQDVAGDSLADALCQRRRDLNEEDRRAAAVMCLLEGQREKAEIMLNAPAETIPLKYWNFASTARSKTPGPDPREMEARRLFYAAEQEYRSPETRGAAAEKYKYLLENLAATEIVRRHQTTMLKRSESGKECALVAAEMKSSGAFKRGAWEGLVAWTCQKEVPDAEALATFVDIDFHALPQTAYRCWIFMGACCLETFQCYMQATDMRGPNPRKLLEKVPYDPGKPYAAEIKIPPGRLKKTHAQHGGPKQPTQWMWVEIPLPKYPGPGPKKIRILSQQQGFSVAFAVVSSLRKSPPDEAETKELAKVEVPPAAPEPGIPDPQEWLLAGPFAPNLGAAEPPEGHINLKAQMKGRDGDVSWKFHISDLGENRLARINFIPLFERPNDMCVYALAHVQSPRAADARLLVGSDDGVKVWVNGKVVHTNDRDRALKVDEDRVDIRLIEGWNRLLFKVRNKGGDYALSMRVVDRENRPIDGLLYDAYGDLESP